LWLKRRSMGEESAKGWERTGTALLLLLLSEEVDEIAAAAEEADKDIISLR
jgi:hypothetical protein